MFFDELFLFKNNSIVVFYLHDIMYFSENYLGIFFGIRIVTMCTVVLYI